jgi:hypothetical protein
MQKARCTGKLQVPCQRGPGPEVKELKAGSSPGAAWRTDAVPCATAFALDWCRDRPPTHRRSARRLGGSLPESLRSLREDLEQNFKATLQAALAGSIS